ncbi:MAG: leucyl aminopeptidase [Alteromonadaceae bacterium]|jgi:leucyl aminopeptidase
MNRLFTMIVVLSSVILSDTVYGQSSPEKQVWISLGTDAVALLNKEKPNGINLNPVYQSRFNRNDSSVVQIGESQLDALSEFMHENLNRCGGFFFHESFAQAQAFTMTPAQGFSTIAVSYTLDNASGVDELLTKLNTSNLSSTIGSLSNYHNRYYSQQSGVDAASWLRSHWQSIGSARSDISVELYQHSWQQPSVIATIIGTESPDEVIVIGGHLDSINLSNKSAGRAPGVDDNASGIAVVTETLNAIVASGFKPKRTIKLIGYAAEEVGLRGSQAIAQSFKSNGTNVIGVAQFDMTGNKGTSSEDIVFMTDYTNSGQNQFMSQLIDTYLPGISYGFDQCGYACSDHASWHNQGYPASMPFESRVSDINSRIHTSNDTYFDVNHVTKFAKLSLAFVAELAKGSSGDIPDDEFEKLTNGVTKASLSGSAKQQLFYTLDVPAGATSLNFVTSGSNGDADLYIKFGSKPSLNNSDCKSTSSSSNENCQISNIQEGKYYVMVEAWSAISGLSLTGTYRDGGNNTPDPIHDVTKNISFSRGQWHHYTQDLVAGYTNMTVTVSGGSGDSDLYLRHGSKSTSTLFDCKSDTPDNNETCTMNLPAAGTWYIDLYGYSSASGVTLTVEAQP